jgi:hypothetical protein
LRLYRLRFWQNSRGSQLLSAQNYCREEPGAGGDGHAPPWVATDASFDLRPLLFEYLHGFRSRRRDYLVGGRHTAPGLIL